jgi:hypothetical protein
MAAPLTEDEKTEKALRELEQLARLLDTQWRIPFTSIRFGLDAAAGLLPVVGDGAAGLIGAYILFGAARHGAPTHVLARMFVNLALDTAIGSVPIAGTVFDVWYKANKRNVALWREHLMAKGKIIEGEAVRVPAGRTPNVRSRR